MTICTSLKPYTTKNKDVQLNDIRYATNISCVYLHCICLHRVIHWCVTLSLYIINALIRISCKWCGCKYPQKNVCMTKVYIIFSISPFIPNNLRNVFPRYSLDPFKCVLVSWHNVSYGVAMSCVFKLNNIFLKSVMCADTTIPSKDVSMNRIWPWNFV